MRPLELLFVVALVLYSAVIWTNRVKGTLTVVMVSLFGIGLLADISGTVLLCANMGTVQWRWTLHTITGVLSLVIMALHFGWAVGALTTGKQAREKFHRFSMYAWVLWLISFVSGIPLH